MKRLPQDTSEGKSIGTSPTGETQKTFEGGKELKSSCHVAHGSTFIIYVLQEPLKEKMQAINRFRNKQARLSLIN